MVGATNVGSIKMAYHPSFMANLSYGLGEVVQDTVEEYMDKTDLIYWKDGGVRLDKG
jgi:phosphatidylserine decarboxylase